MTAQVRRTLRGVGTWLLGVVVPVAAQAFVPVHPAAIAADSLPAMSISTAVAKPSFLAGPREGLTVELTGPAKSAGHRYNRRSSAEDTTSPAPDVLQAAVLRVAIEPETRPRPAPMVRRSAFASPATRQRAP